MGFFNKILGGQKKEYPPFDLSTPAGQKFQQVKDSLEMIAQKVNDPLEVVPGSDKTFVFVGKPPQQFGMFWIQGREVLNFTQLAKEKNIPQGEFQSLSEQLREAYKNNAPEQKFSTRIADKTVTVLPSDSLGKEVNRIVKDL